jgi:uncharacterized protein with GYD domain
MALYLTCFSYTNKAWKAMVKQPEDRRVIAKQIIESVGGTLHGFWYAFGKYDGYTLWEAPDNVRMASVTLALLSGEAIKSQETIILLTVEEAIAALKGTSRLAYYQPGQRN